jgi:dihydrofolate reductase
MRNIILSLAMSLDGKIEGPNQEYDWIPMDPESGAELNEFARGIDTVLYGRVSYELFGNYRPGGESPKEEQEFYAAVDGMKKYVFSATKTDFDGNPVLIKNDVKAQVRALKAQPGKDIWLFGGAKLITTLMNLGLVDRLEIAVVPMVLGEGNPAFKNLLARHALRLLKTKQHHNGIVMLSYAVETDKVQKSAE